MVTLKVTNIDDILETISKIEEISSILQSITINLRSVVGKDGWHSGFDKGERDLPSFIVSDGQGSGSDPRTIITPNIIDGYVEDVDDAELKRITSAINLAILRLRTLYSRLELFEERNRRMLPLSTDVAITSTTRAFMISSSVNQPSFANLAALRQAIKDGIVAGADVRESLCRSFRSAGFGGDYFWGSTLISSNCLRLSIVYIQDINMYVPVTYFLDRTYESRWMAVFPSEYLDSLNLIQVESTNGQVMIDDVNTKRVLTLVYDIIFDVDTLSQHTNSPKFISVDKTEILPTGREVPVMANDLSLDHIIPTYDSQHIDRTYPLS